MRILCSHSREAQRRVIAAGGVKMIVLAVQSHSDYERLQQEALGILAKLAALDPKAVMDSGGLEAVIGIMEMFPQYSWVQGWGCQAIRHCGAQNKQRVADMTGFEKCEDVLKS